MTAYKYILFDWGGTLAQTLDLWPDALDEALQKRGIQLNRRQLIESCKGFRDYVTAHTNMSWEEATEVLSEGINIVASRTGSVELYPGAPQVLRQLKASGKRLALITTSERRLIAPVLARLDLSNIFEVLICDEDVEREKRKPHPEPLLKALAKLGGTPNQALMVGDRDKDILAGHNAKIDSVLFYPPEHEAFYGQDEMAAPKPTYTIRKLPELLDYAT